MDFVSDTLSCGRRFRALTIVDCHSRECLALEVDTSLNGERVVRVLERLKETRGLPTVIQTDNGPEFTGHMLDAWSYKNRVKLFFIEPGHPLGRSRCRMPISRALTASFVGALWAAVFEYGMVHKLTRGAAGHRRLANGIQSVQAAQLTEQSATRKMARRTTKNMIFPPKSISFSMLEFE